MRLVLIAMLATGIGAYAQHSGGPAGGGGFHGSGGGFHGSTGSRGPANRGGSRGGYYGGPRSGYVRPGAVIVPYPAFYGGYYYYDPSMYGNGYADQQPPADNGYNAGYDTSYGPNYDPGNGASGPSPVVIINQSFRPETANPVLKDYSNTTIPEPGTVRMPPGSEPGLQSDDQPTVFLIAMKDHTIFPAVAYWVEGDTLNYITTEGSQNRASLSLVDRDFSKQLNDERHVEFRLPAPR